MDLPAVRAELDRVDREILALLERRMAMAVEASKLKKEVHDPEREVAVLSAMLARESTLRAGFRERLWRDIMWESKRVQHNARRRGRPLRVLVGSANPVKLDAVREAFEQMMGPAEAEGLKVPSGVSDQPRGEEAFMGAANRARALVREAGKRGLDADYFVGAEGGVVIHSGRTFAYGCMCIMDREGKTAFGLSPHFELSEDIARRVNAGEELGDVMNEITGEPDTKTKGGSIAFFTGGRMDRREFYLHGLVMALVPFLHPERYFGSDGASKGPKRAK